MSDTGKTIALIKALAPAPEIDPEEIKQDVEDWLDDHPEATTTVQDGAITKAKLNASLQETVDDVDALKTALTVNTTITWNQLSKLANNWAMNWGAGTVTKNNDEIIVANAPANYYAYTGIATTPTANHKYLFMCYAKASNATAGIYLYISDSTVQATTTSGDYTLLSVIATASSSVTSFNYSAQLRCFASSSGTVYFKNPKMFDLTMLGLDGITSADDFVRVFPDWSSSGVDTTGTQRKLTFIEDFALKNFNRQYYINAKDMGAVGDGTTDDTAALQKCIDYGAENGLSVFIPAGMYMISSTLNNKGTTVFGASLTTADEEYGTTIKATSAMSAMMTTITGSGENYNETAFKHLTFNGNQLANIGISISKGLELDDVYCIGAVYSGAHFTDCYRGLIKRSIFNHNGYYGVRLTHRNNNVVFVNCIMNDNGSASGHANVMIENDSATTENNACLKFISCEIDTATTGYNVSISGADAVSFDGCYFEKSNESSFLIRGNGVNALNITNCYFLDLDFNLTFNGAFIGNAFRLINKESGTAIATESSTNGLLIGGNYIEDGYTTE